MGTNDSRAPLRTTLTVLLVGSLTIAGLSACDRGTSGTSSATPTPEVSMTGGTAGTGGTGSPTPEPGLGASLPGLPGTGPSKYPGRSSGSGEMTLTGQVEAGVEHNCLIMKVGAGVYNLLGGDRSVVYAGARVTVRGRTNTHLMTTCQQGVPFQVTEAHPA